MIPHDYQLQCFKEDGTPLGKAILLPLGGVLSEGVEALHWQSFVETGRGLADPIEVVPRWSPDAGEPVVEALCLESGSSTVSLPATRLFHPMAVRQRTRLLEDGALKESESYGFLVTARPAEEPSPLPVFSLADYPLSTQRIEIGGEPVDAEFAAAGDFPVLIAPKVLRDAVNLAEVAGEAEAGGVLFGHLMKTVDGTTVALSITHLWPATGGRGDQSSFTFTPETWTSAAVALAERSADELMVGSFHSHPDFCRKCPPERQAVCKLREPFFSRDDEQLQQSVFPAGYSVGLLASHDGEKPIPSLWGWRDGFTARRSYLIPS
ncbi:hypothetical protein [Haloferula sp. A504]|uniref:hypothetical protein n=1 Tax=Haloferula sp. A504 TaxID=3373601 RepID=UPI0031CA3B04|nr:Mov34/MPN/PAD-1 family protein [Verrucomicrobiaceae bacterium E54]